MTTTTKGAKRRHHHTYKGCLITPSTSVHWRWESWCDGAIYADTLSGMRELIRHRLRATA